MKGIKKVLDILRNPSFGKICDLQREISKLPQIDFTPEHYFAPGMYVRKQVIEKDILVVGKMHRHEHVAFLMQGSATVVTADGRVKMKAPHIWISPAGAKRVVYTHTRCVFATAHATNETDIEKVEDFVIIPEKEYLNELGSNRNIGSECARLSVRVKKSTKS